MQDYGRPADRWFCGPPAERRAYAVDDIRGIQGGQGMVVRAERRTFVGDTVGYWGPASLKVITRPPSEPLATLQARWARLAAVDHRHLARALEVFQGPGLFRADIPPEDDGVLYMAATWVEGRGLREVAPLPPDRAVAMAQDVAAGLAALHDRGLVHRDVHPGNVVVDDEGRAVLIDLGSARGDDHPPADHVAGTLGFVPPEAPRDTGSRAADHWALGMLTVFALLGHPQGATTDERLDAELTTALADIGQPRRAQRLLRAMVDRDPARRPTDPERWAADLAGCLPARRHRPSMVAAVAATVVVLALAGAALRSAGADGGEDATGGRGDRGATTTTVTSPSSSGCAPIHAGSGDGSAALAQAVAALAPEACSADDPERFARAYVQPLADADGRPVGVVLVTPRGRRVRLNQTEWDSYRAVGNNNPETTVGRVGYPREVGTRGEWVEVDLTVNGYLIGDRDDTQLFWLPAQVQALWQAHPELGLPTSNPYLLDHMIYLDFEYGYMADHESQIDEILKGAEPRTLVTDVDRETWQRGNPPRGAIVRQASLDQVEPRWWVDGDGVRHWIPDDATFDCLGGEAMVAYDHLRGYEVSSLTLGDQATCP
jgi:hypothetical protein